MCLLMVIHRSIAGFPVVLAANRDEYYARPSAEPQLLRHAPVAWGGRDLRAGGTWLGVNEYGLVVGLTNRRRGENREADSDRRSRGLLCLEALQYRRAAEVIAHLDCEASYLYNPFNLFIVDPDEAFWIAYEGSPETHRLQPGLYFLANGNLNDFETVRIRRARLLLQGPPQTPLERLLPLLEQVCRDHEEGVPDRETICMHREDEQYGTVSSTIIALSMTLGHSIYRYAEHHPCDHPYRDYSALFTS